jgi:hypothetical protein
MLALREKKAHMWGHPDLCPAFQTVNNWGRLLTWLVDAELGGSVGVFGMCDGVDILSGGMYSG